MEIKAKQVFVVTSPKKLRKVVYSLKGMTPLEAVERLPFMTKRAVVPVLKVVKTAIANAKQKGLKEDKLYFKEFQIQEGPRLKRARAGVRGRVKPYKKRTSHIRVILTTEPKIYKRSKTTDFTDLRQSRRTNLVKSKKIAGNILKSKGLGITKKKDKNRKESV